MSELIRARGPALRVSPPRVRWTARATGRPCTCRRTSS